MAAPTGDFYGVGARYARALVLDSLGIPAATAASGAVYEGYELATLKNFNVEYPDIRTISHYGGDKIRAIDSLPPNQMGSAKAALGSINPATYAALTTTKVITIGEATGMIWGSSKLGYEDDICLWVVQQEESSGGLRRWRLDIIPVARATIKNAAMNENPAEYPVDLTPAIATAYPWHIAFTESIEGCTSGQVATFHTNNFPFICAWKGDNVVTKFSFGTGHNAAVLGESFDVHGVWVIDAATHVSAKDATPTLAADGVTPTTKPDTGDIVVAFYGLATAPE